MNTEYELSKYLVENKQPLHYYITTEMQYAYNQGDITSLEGMEDVVMELLRDYITQNTYTSMEFLMEALEPEYVASLLGEDFFIIDEPVMN